MNEINLTYFESKGEIYIPFKEHVEIVETLQQRINKAIEYIDRRDIEWGSKEYNNLLDILKGVDKE